jgi:hypothetical protein
MPNDKFPSHFPACWAAMAAASTAIATVSRGKRRRRSGQYRLHLPTIWGADVGTTARDQTPNIDRLAKRSASVTITCCTCADAGGVDDRTLSEPVRRSPAYGKVFDTPDHAGQASPGRYARHRRQPS